MALAEVPTLSGYRYDVEDLQSLTSISEIQRTEYEKDDTKINIYFNPVGLVTKKKRKISFQLGEKPVCLSLMSDLVYQVADQKPAQMVLFDYYNPEDQVHFFFFFLYFSLNTVTSSQKAIRARNSSYSVPYSYFTRYFTNSFYREDYGNPFSVESFVFVPRCPVADRFVS